MHQTSTATLVLETWQVKPWLHTFLWPAPIRRLWYWLYPFFASVGEYRPTTLLQKSNIKWNAGLKPEDFRYKEERVTEKALKKLVEGN
jgi:hypothetical protein